jgi:hypothetical protein
VDIVPLTKPKKHVYVILAEEHQLIRSIFNHHQQVYGAVVFQMPLLINMFNVGGNIKMLPFKN